MWHCTLEDWCQYIRQIPPYSVLKMEAAGSSSKLVWSLELIGITDDRKRDIHGRWNIQSHTHTEPAM